MGSSTSFLLIGGELIYIQLGKKNVWRTNNFTKLVIHNNNNITTKNRTKNKRKQETNNNTNKNTKIQIVTKGNNQNWIKGRMCHGLQGFAFRVNKNNSNTTQLKKKKKKKKTVFLKRFSSELFCSLSKNSSKTKLTFIHVILHFFIIYEKFWSSYLGNQGQEQEQCYPIPISVCSIFVVFQQWYMAACGCLGFFNVRTDV